MPPSPASAALAAHPPLRADADGALISSLYDDVFKSRAGALAEARQVFVQGCAIEQRWQGRDAFTILELGFGAGINFAASLLAWRDCPARPARLHYLAVELHPLSTADLAWALERAEVPQDIAEALRRAWPLPTRGLHTLSFASGAVRLTLAFGAAIELVPQLTADVDAFYLDGFAPSRNPQMWSAPLCRGLARLAAAGATLATYSAAASVRAALDAAGFEVRRVPGFGAKRHRLEARYAPRWTPPARSAVRPPMTHAGRRHAAIVGAGLAGAAVAAALCARGWTVDLFDAAPEPARGGSAQPVCADHVHVSPDDNLLARLCRNALMNRSRLAWSGRTASDAIGRLVVAASDAAFERQRQLVDTAGLPAEFIRHVDADEACTLAGILPARGGLWLPTAGAAVPAELVGHWIDHAGASCRFHPNVQIRTIGRRAEDWQLEDGTGGRWAAPVVVLANAADATRLAGMRMPALRAIGGQTSRLRSPSLAGLRCTLGGEAYACPIAHQGDVLVGATFESDGEMLDVERAHESNLARLSRVLAPESLEPAPLVVDAHRGERAVAPDRLPLVGPLPDEAAALAERDRHHRNDRLALPRADGLYGAFAFGARGLLFATLAAEVIAASVEAEPLPIEQSLLDALDPARFLRRRLRYTTRFPSAATNP